MKRVFSLITAFMLCLSMASITFAGAVNPTSNPPTKSYLIGFHSNVDLNLIKVNGGEIRRTYKYMPVVAVKLSEKAVRALNNNPKIEYIEEDGFVQTIGQITPWGVPHVKATDVQNTGVNGYGIKVGIIDTGIDYNHEDLQVVGGETFVQGTTDYMDDNGHGTHVAGTVAALDNALGVLGVAPKVNLYAIKVLNQHGEGSYSDLVAGIEWAIVNDLNIMNMSIGGSSSSITLQRAVDNAYNAEILLVASAGNSGFDQEGNISYPARYDSVIAVGAIDQQNNRASFSSVGRELELTAPGVGVKSTVPGGYASYNGTSMAAPYVVGVAALVWQEKPELNNVQIRNSLNQTAISLGDSFSFGNGLVDALGAINYSETTKTTTGVGKKSNK